MYMLSKGNMEVY